MATKGEYILIASCTDNFNTAQMLAGAVGYVGPDSKSKFLVIKTEAPQLQKRIQEVDSITWLVGESLPGVADDDEAWRIKQVSSTSALAAQCGAVSVVYADNTAGFTKKWTDAATYDYNIPS